ncbi:MAG TPA: hypothetical protein VGW74_09340 [Propionibacteriaceae bacterium]|nr:hypothetical protein [Propionibacteriaceae bacterium]
MSPTDPGPDRTWVFVRVGGYGVYGWRLVAWVVGLSIAQGIGRGIGGALW